jgi:hypothetical protein
MTSVPVDVLFGPYPGVPTGIVPALVAWALGFASKHVTGVTVPAFGVGAAAAPVGRLVGDRLATDVFAVVGADGSVDGLPDDRTLAGDAVYVVARPETYRRLDARSRSAA